MAIDKTISRGSLHTARNLRAVSPHAEDDLPGGPCRALWVNDTGVVTVAVVAADDTAAITLSITGPGRIDVAARAVRISGTNASSIVALY